MNTNPFRQTKAQPVQADQQDSFFQSEALGSANVAGQRLSVDTRAAAAPSSLDRHVSFASPPVDTTIPAASYPSSPDSTRSPQWQFAAPATPNYRTAFDSDPFEGLGKALNEDKQLQQAQTNALSNTGYAQDESTSARGRQNDVRDTLSRFAAAPARQQTQDEPPLATVSEPLARKSLDVDAFKRLLLTGERDVPGAPDSASASINSTDNSYGSEAISIAPSYNGYSAAFRAGIQDNSEAMTKMPPPAPAPRRGKSLKMKQDDGLKASDLSEQKVGTTAPTPPVPRRHSQQAPIITNQEDMTKSAVGPEQISKRSTKPPPPPPVRRQHSLTQQRPPNDLAPTIGGQEPDAAASLSSRRSSHERPPAPSSRNSSLSMKRQSVGSPNLPPVPPPRRVRTSSRASTESFRPSLSEISGEELDQENVTPSSDARLTNYRAQREVSASNAGDILAELANLQNEVDAARRAGAG